MSMVASAIVVEMKDLGHVSRGDFKGMEIDQLDESHSGNASAMICRATEENEPPNQE
jgi:hypothetical protein